MGATTTESSFSFDPPPSPRSARSAEKTTTRFSFDASSNEPPYVGNKSFKSKAGVENKENVRTPDTASVKSNKKAENGSGHKKERRSSRLSNIFCSTKDSSSASSNKERHESTTKSSRKINSAPVYRKNSSISQKFDIEDDDSASTANSSDLTMFPFDREAIDYERIQRECFAVEEEFDMTPGRKNFPYEYDADDSPSLDTPDQKIAAEGIFQQYAMLSQMEKERQSKKRPQKSPTEMKPLTKLERINQKLNETSALIHDQPSSNVTSPIPDLKIDFFAESSLTASRENEKEKSDALDVCQIESVTSSFGSKSGNTNGSINLTSNPMSTAVVTTPRATIVVQQVCSYVSCFLDSCVLCFREKKIFGDQFIARKVL